MYTIQGKGVSGGVANGPLCFYRRGDHDIAKHEIADTEAESSALNRLARPRWSSSRHCMKRLLQR